MRVVRLVRAQERQDQLDLSIPFSSSFRQARPMRRILNGAAVLIVLPIYQLYNFGLLFRMDAPRSAWATSYRRRCFNPAG